MSETSGQLAQDRYPSYTDLWQKWESAELSKRATSIEEALTFREQDLAELELDTRRLDPLFGDRATEFLAQGMYDVSLAAKPLLRVSALYKAQAEVFLNEGASILYDGRTPSDLEPDELEGVQKELEGALDVFLNPMMMVGDIYFWATVSESSLKSD